MKSSREPRLSVVIPVRERAASLMVAIQSVVTQTRPPHEIIVVDDGSLVPPEISSDFGGVEVRVIRLPMSGGPSAARQAGVEAARGELIAFLDSDDAWLPWKIAAQLERIRDRSLEDLWAVSCGWFYTDRRGRLSSRIVPIEAAELRLFAAGCWFNPGSTVLLPRGVFARVGGFDPTLKRLEDYEWFVRFGAAGGRLLVASAAETVIFRRPRSSEHVEAAARLLLQRFRDGWIKEQAALRSGSAWLEVERGVAAIRQGKLAGAARHFGKSLLWRPRLRLQLENWWTRERVPVQDLAVSLARSLASAASKDAEDNRTAEIE